MNYITLLQYEEKVFAVYEIVSTMIAYLEHIIICMYLELVNED